MRIRHRVPLFATGVAGALALAVTALPANAQDDEPEVSEVRGHASGIFVELEAFFDGVSFDTSFGPEPFVSLPPEGGGPFTDSLTEAVLEDAPDYLNDVLGFDFEVSTEGALGTDGFAESSSALTVDLFDDLFLADLISTECRTDLVDGPTGSTTILGGEFLQHGDESGVSDVPENPEPNTVLVDFEFDDVVDGTGDIISILLVLNEQTVTDNDITVTGLSFFLDAQEFVEGEIVDELLINATVAESSCGLDIAVPPEPIEPTTTTTTPEHEDDELAIEAVVASPRFTG